MLDALSSPATGLAGGGSSSATHWLLALVIGVKCIKVLGLYVAYDLLKSLHLVTFLFITLGIFAAFLVYKQKPFSSGPPLSKATWVVVAKYAFFTLVYQLFWFYGLTLCGPLRSILVSEQPALALSIGFLSLVCQGQSGVSSPAKTRGAILFLLGVLSLLLIDHDDNSPHHQAYHAGHANQHQEIYTIFTHMFSWTDISDHKGGVLVLSGLLILQSIIGWYGRRAAVQVGGTKRLGAFAALLSFLFLSPWALLNLLKQGSWGLDLSSNLALIFISVSVLVADFYIDSALSVKADKERLTRCGIFASFVSSSLLSVLWTQSMTFDGGHHLDPNDGIVHVPLMEDHQISPGVFLGIFFFFLATLNLTTSGRGGTRAFFVGYSSAGLPMYNITSESIHEAGQSIFRTAKQGMAQILEDGNSRRIFFFLLLNLAFTFVEFTYGVWTNSLGLISDGFHMLFDCSALVMGLYASVLSRWRPSKAFSFGYERLEVLSGYVNGLFLAVIALNVFTEGVRRLFDPPTVGTERLLAVSIGGLLVNMVGIAAFTFGSHGHSHGGGSHGHSHNANMQGVFLHILADTLGSVGVIVSSLLIEYYGWNIADPICSLFIAVTIFVSVIPLLSQSMKVLLLVSDEKVREAVRGCVEHLSESVPGYIQVQHVNVWTHTNEKVFATITLMAQENCDTQLITNTVCRLLRECGVHYPVVQVQSKQFEIHLQGLGTKFPFTSETSANHRLAADPISVGMKASSFMGI
ncbi:proton-coupled zinc antiporter SLC30A5-like [Tigriopus californicus]|uniref:proton-coupled zinc antiporter SLC30A5-like n=1 Tax=Tigriopus californicus TaxID=6832 RepID=UPI0027DA6DA3|nr:proton-coupled zinc antiporter SLC30A5-like [Tigriopus californicus]